MYGITKTKMINPFHITSIDYIVDEVVGTNNQQTGHVYIQMSNQPDGKAYEIAASCANCERIIMDLISIVKRINRDEDNFTDLTIIPGGNIDFSTN